MPEEDIATGIERLMRVKIEDSEGMGVKTLDVPVFNLKFVEERNCARYTRLAAKYLFGLEYPVHAAWELADEIGTQKVENNDELIELEAAGILSPGRLIGVFIPDSKSNLDTRAYTHVALYLGVSADRRGDMLFAEQMIDKTRVQPFFGYCMDGLQIKDILFLK